MFANLNLQLTSLLTSGDAGLAGAEGVVSPELLDDDAQLSFAEFFNTSTEEAQQLLLADGEILPQDGKPLPPVLLHVETEMPDKLITAQEEPPTPPDLQPELPLKSVLALPDVELQIPLDYKGNDIPAEIPDEPLVLPPGLTLTATTPVLPTTQIVPPENYQVPAHKMPRPVTFVPPSPPPATLTAPLDVAEDIVAQANPLPLVAELTRGREQRPASPMPSTTAIVGEDIRETTDLRRLPGIPAAVVPNAVVESQLRTEPRLPSVPHGPSGPALNLAAAPGSFANDLNALRTDVAAETISTPVREPSWGQKLAERVVMLAGAQNKTAEIRLTPAELGPLRVQIKIDEGQANVAFHAHNAVTREAIELALPRLREMLAESGLSLGQADVGEQGVAGGERERDATANESSATQSESTEEPADSVEEGRQKSVISNALVDTFA